MSVFEIKPVSKDFGFRFSAADVYNEFLYVGDEKGTSNVIKGTLYSYPFRSSES